MSLCRGALINLCCDMVKLRAKNSGVELLRAYPENLDEITGDKRACTQILINLLSNAIKFTPPNGSVTISASPEPHYLLILVADTGIGIAEPDLAHLGDPFFQAKAIPDRQEKERPWPRDRARSRRMQGGTITVASEPDKGPASRCDCRSIAVVWPPKREPGQDRKRLRACMPTITMTFTSK